MITAAFVVAAILTATEPLGGNTLLPSGSFIAPRSAHVVDISRCRQRRISAFAFIMPSLARSQFFRGCVALI